MQSTTVREVSQRTGRCRALRVVLGGSLAVALVAGTVLPASAGEAQDDFVDVKAALNGRYQMESGRPISAVRSADDVGETVINGTTASGDLVRLVIQSSPPRDEMQERVLADAERRVTPGPPGYSETPPEPDVMYSEGAPIAERDGEWAPVAVTATTPSTAAFLWPIVESFDVIVDGRWVARSDDDGVARVADFTPGASYSVELAERALIGRESVARRLVRLPISGDEGQPERAEGATYQWTNFMHKTFIQEERVPAAQCNYLNPAFEFGGDGRSFRMPFPDEQLGILKDFRTLMMTAVSWDEGAGWRFMHFRSVGPTRIYEKGQLINTLYADMDDMTFESAENEGSYARVYLRHTSSNPACKLWDVNYAGAITYGEWVEFYRSGTVAVDGYRFRAPAHEMYAQLNESTSTVLQRAGYGEWVTLSRRQNEGFQCLLGNLVCPLDFYKVSATVP